MHGFAALPALETRAAWLRERSALVYKNQIGRWLSMQLTGEGLSSLSLCLYCLLQVHFRELPD
jgi:hypothetical protein